ncbi:unnamed protein product, partial [Rotaria sp. Silwood2]
DGSVVATRVADGLVVVARVADGCVVVVLVADEPVVVAMAAYAAAPSSCVSTWMKFVSGKLW